ncbi:hypothetical protein EGI22_09160 [Lacihabitans sp. LS3-19]|nr:hypothetical protein [Lacihabitans sp. LS3-19]
MEKPDFPWLKDNNLNLKINTKMDKNAVKMTLSLVLMIFFITKAFLTKDSVDSQLYSSLAVIFGLLANATISNPKRVN